MGNHNFYKNFYSSQKTEPSKQNEFLNIQTPMLTLNNHNFCEGYIAENKLQHALHMMENNKSPGLDGLSTNFYKCLRPILGNESTTMLLIMDIYLLHNNEVLSPCFLRKGSHTTAKLETDNVTEYGLQNPSQSTGKST